jgi:hypothetical protein
MTYVTPPVDCSEEEHQSSSEARIECVMYCERSTGNWICAKAKAGAAMSTRSRSRAAKEEEEEPRLEALDAAAWFSGRGGEEAVAEWQGRRLMV